MKTIYACIILLFLLIGCVKEPNPAPAKDSTESQRMDTTGKSPTDSGFIITHPDWFDSVINVTIPHN